MRKILFILISLFIFSGCLNFESNNEKRARLAKVRTNRLKNKKVRLLKITKERLAAVERIKDSLKVNNLGEKKIKSIIKKKAYLDSLYLSSRYKLNASMDCSRRADFENSINHEGYSDKDYVLAEETFKKIKGELSLESVTSILKDTEKEIEEKEW